MMFNLLDQCKEVPLGVLNPPIRQDYPVLLIKDDGEDDANVAPVRPWAWKDQAVDAQRIGADPTDVEEVAPHFVNKLAPSGVIWDDATKRYVARINYDAGPAPDNRELMDRLEHLSGGEQAVYDKLPLVPDVFNPSKWLETSTQGRAMVAERPRFVRSSDFPRWPRLPVCFPVYVGYPHFGSGLALSHIALAFNNDGAEQYFAVMKMVPLGQISGAPFNGGIWSVKATWCLRMPVAVMDLVIAEDLVTLVNDRGERWGESFTAFSRSKRWEYKVARDALVRDFPSLLAGIMCTRLRVGRPKIYEKSGPINYPSSRTVNLEEAARTRGKRRGKEDEEDVEDDEDF